MWIIFYTQKYGYCFLYQAVCVGIQSDQQKSWVCCCCYCLQCSIQLKVLHLTLALGWALGYQRVFFPSLFLLHQTPCAYATEKFFLLLSWVGFFFFFFLSDRNTLLLLIPQYQAYSHGREPFTPRLASVLCTCHLNSPQRQLFSVFLPLPLMASRLLSCTCGNG